MFEVPANIANIRPFIKKKFVSRQPAYASLALQQECMDTASNSPGFHYAKANIMYLSASSNHPEIG